MPASIAIVIVNWNSRDQLRDCLASIPRAAAQLGPTHRVSAIVVVDNHSSDGSELGLQAGDLPLTLLRNSSNRGFAAACNQGAAAVGDCDLILFLNPDTLVFDDSLATPARVLDSPMGRDVGIIGIQLCDDSQQVARSCSRFPRAGQVLSQALGLDRLRPSLGQAMREWDHASSRTVEQVIGAFFMVRTDLFSKLGGFDERFFVYFEEVDFAYRALQAGWRSLYIADAHAFHKGGGTSDQIRATRLFYTLRSRLQYFRKHGSTASVLVVLASTYLLEPATRLLMLVAARRFGELGDLAQAYKMLIAWQARERTAS